jgi:O-antigen/teichoic acid export membrane protein
MLQRKNKISQTLAANKKHIDSSLFLFFINVFNFIFPLLLSPIIISRCGVEGFGVVTLFQSIMLFVASITDYGFNINATREVTINQNNKEFINRYFFTISYAKSFLLSVALILAFIIFLFFPKASEYSLV